jgi:hypothetical protein
MPDNSLKVWAASARANNNPTGDAIRDMRSDDTLPDCRTFEELRAHAFKASRGQSYHSDVHRALAAAWRRYLQWRARQ